MLSSRPGAGIGINKRLARLMLARRFCMQNFEEFLFFKFYAFDGFKKLSLNICVGS